MLLLLVVLLVIIIYLIDDLLIDKRQLELVKRLNGPIRLPIIGTAYRAIGKSNKGIKIKLKFMKLNY
jgi:hypothetical protein